MKFVALTVVLFLQSLSSAACLAAGSYRIVIAYGAARAGDSASASARAALVNAHALEELQQFLTPFRLPADLTIRAEACGAPRRAYDASAKTVTICYETIAQILSVAQAQIGATDQDRNNAIVGAIVETLLHETAYGVFDLYHAPIWGRIDDAADRLTALVMLQFGEDDARLTILGTARFFLWSAKTWTGFAFSSAQSPEAQRFYNFLCIAYGGDPITFDSLKTGGVLPDSRLAQCDYEYQQVRKAFDLRLMPFMDPDLFVTARARKW